MLVDVVLMLMFIIFEGFEILMVSFDDVMPYVFSLAWNGWVQECMNECVWVSEWVADSLADWQNLSGWSFGRFIRLDRSEINKYFENIWNYYEDTNIRYYPDGIFKCSGIFVFVSRNHKHPIYIQSHSGGYIHHLMMMMMINLLEIYEMLIGVVLWACGDDWFMNLCNSSSTNTHRFSDSDSKRIIRLGH